MEFKDVVYLRRSNRFLKSNPIDKEKIDYILELAMRSPVALGKYQDISLLLIEGVTLKNLQNRLSGLIGKDPTYGAGALIAILHKEGNDVLNNQDAGIIGQTICLVSTEKELGNVYLYSVAPYMNEDSYIKDDLLKIDSRYKVMCAVALGEKSSNEVRDVEHKFDVKKYN